MVKKKYWVEYMAPTGQWLKCSEDKNTASEAATLKLAAESDNNTLPREQRKVFRTNHN